MNSLLRVMVPILFFGIYCGAQTLPDKVEQLLAQTTMEYSIPPDFQTTSIKDNGDVVYDFAVKSKTSSLEIRYRIMPIDKSLNDPNALFEPMMVTMALNISNGIPIQMEPYPAESVKEEFGADSGGAGLVPLDSDFGEGYQSCMISVIHKDDTADAFVFFLFNTQEEIMTALTTDSIYHALKFK